MLEPFVAAGKARAIGVSNFNSTLLDFLLPRVNVTPAVNQCGFSIAGHFDSSYGSDDDTVTYCKKHGIQYEAYSPDGNVAIGSTDAVVKDPTVEAVAKAHNRSTYEVAIKWVVQQDIVVVTSTNNVDETVDDLRVLRRRRPPCSVAKVAR